MVIQTSSADPGTPYINTSIFRDESIWARGSHDSPIQWFGRLDRQPGRPLDLQRDRNEKWRRHSGLVGWEFHGDPAPIAGLQVIATGKTINSGNRSATYTATVYPGPGGNWVFNASTIFWSIGLSAPPGLVPPYSHFGRPHGPDERVQKITSNFFARCGVKV